MPIALSVASHGVASTTTSQIAPTPYNKLVMNRTLADGTLNKYYPGATGSSVATPNITLDPTFGTNTGETLPTGANPGYIYVNWRDMVTGPRIDTGMNNQQRFVATLDGVAAGWDYQVGAKIGRAHV